MFSNIARAVAATALVIALGGCAAAAAGAAAGAATGIYLTTRGAEGIVEGSVDAIARRAERVYADMGITVTGREYEIEDGEREFELKGERGDLDVTTKIEPETATTTRVHVEAQKSLVEWDQDFARAVVERIVTR